MNYKQKEKVHRLLSPDEFADTIYDITPDFLKSWNIKALILDIDNTLAPYDTPSPDEKLIDHLKEITNTGIKIALVSNNDASRVNLFNEKLGFFSIPRSGKPYGKGIGKCIKNFGENKENILLVGDQLYTDVLGAHHNGIRAVVVKPIKEKENTFFKIKRLAERPFLKYYRKKMGK